MVGDVMASEYVSDAPDQAQSPSIVCPLCTAPQPPDVWDALDGGVVQRMNCCSCRKSFNFRIDECEHCCHEVAATWVSEEEPPVIAHAVPCPSCGHTASLVTTDDDDEPAF